MRPVDKQSFSDPANHEIRLPSHLFKTAFEHAADGLVIMDTNRRILYMNPSAQQFVDEQNISGLHCGDLFHCHDDDNVSLQSESCFGKCVLTLQTSMTNVEFNIVSNQGEKIPVEVTYSYVPDEDGAVYLLMSIRDIRDRKRLDQERKQKDELRYTLEERERLARDLHDGVVQDIAYANMQMKLLLNDVKNGVDLDPLRIKHITEILEQSFVDLRQAIHDLTFRVQDDLESYIKQYISSFMAGTGLEVHLDISEVPHMEPHISNQIAKVIQEALSNVRKHAKASLVKLSLHHVQKDDMLIATVSDDGRGFLVSQDPGPDHYGIATMKERCKLIGGRLTIESEPGKGTTIRMTVPLH